MNQNERLLDASIGHAVDIQTYGTTLVRRVIALLNRVDPDLVAQVVRARESLPEDSFTVQRLDALLASVRRLNNQSYQQAYGLVERELEELADLEVTWQTAQIAQAPGVAMAAVDSDQVAAAALSRPFQGRLLREWMSGLEAEKAATIRDAIRIGYIEGQTTDQIVRRIRGTKSAGYADGLLEINRKNAQSIVLTAVNHTANFAANAVYEANADVIKAVKYSAVLDARTTALCFVDSTEVVSVGNLEKVFRAKYKGEVVTVTTASGKKITGTPNHPVLTPNGFLPLGELNPGKHIVYSVRNDILDFMGDQDVSMKTTIGGLFDSLNKPTVSNIFRKSPSAIDFYGDGMRMYGEIDIVSPNSKLRGRFISGIDKFVKNKLLSFIHDAFSLPVLRNLSNSLVSWNVCSKPPQIDTVFSEYGVKPAFAPRVDGSKNFARSDAFFEHFKGDRSISADVRITLAAFENWHNFCLFQKRGNSSGACPVDSGNLSGRNAGLVFEDNVVMVSREFRDCHVYSLGNSLGFYIAGGIIVKNCRGRDGNLYPLGKSRPSLPAHVRCRSTYVPILKSFREMGIDADDFTATQRASMDGQVPGDLTYNDWLKRQSAARQDEVLGVTKAKLFRTGELTLDRFIARDGAELTLAQLRQKYPDVFKKADL